MKKLLTGIVVLALANLAFAVPAFDINGGTEVVFDINNPASMTQTIPVHVSNATGVTGMGLNLETTEGKFEIVDLVIDSGTVWAGNTTGASIYHQTKPLPDGTPIPAYLALGQVTPVNTFNIASGTVALVTIKAIGANGDKGTLTTDSPTLGASDLVDPLSNTMGSTQGTVALSIVPEPVSALLLLAGLPLIRRRRA